MKKYPILLSVIAFTLFTYGCGSSSFGGGSGQDLSRSNAKKASKKQGSENLESSKDSNIAQNKTDAGKDKPTQSKSDDEAIGKCLSAWGQNPFGKDAIHNYRKISAAVQVLGMGKGIQDNVRTDEPSLILISASVSVLSKTAYDFLNPNGWYCMKADVNVQTQKTVNLACGAKLADSKVNVNVLSDAEATSVVGVHVLSDVKVKQVGSCAK